MTIKGTLLVTITVSIAAITASFLLLKTWAASQSDAQVLQTITDMYLVLRDYIAETGEMPGSLEDIQYDTIFEVKAYVLGETEPGILYIDLRPETVKRLTDDQYVHVQSIFYYEKINSLESDIAASAGSSVTQILQEALQIRNREDSKKPVKDTG